MSQNICIEEEYRRQHLGEYLMKEAFKEYIKNINMYANNDKKSLKLMKKE